VSPFLTHGVRANCVADVATVTRNAPQLIFHKLAFTHCSCSALGAVFGVDAISFFSQRFINCWNQLPNFVDFSSLFKFKNLLDAIDCSVLTC